MLGFNGGLLGKQRTTSVLAAPGMWFPNEQLIAKGVEVWPPFSIPALSPLLWYDFSDESTVTVSSSQITQVTDKGSGARNLTKSTTGPAYVTGINGLKCVDWGTVQHNNYLRNESTASLTMADVYVVQDASFSTSFPNFNGLIGAAIGEAPRVYGWDLNLALNGFTAAFANGSSISSTISVTTVNSPSLLRFTGASDSTSGFQVGNETQNFGLGRGWYGLIGEIIVFSSILSNRDRANLQSFLAAKWGLTLS